MASDYDGLTVAELKGLLRDRGLPVSGAKATCGPLGSVGCSGHVEEQPTFTRQRTRSIALHGGGQEGEGAVQVSCLWGSPRRPR